MAMSFSTNSPSIQAEIAHRHEQIAHDFAVAHGWELSIRRLGGLIRRNPKHQARPEDRQVAQPGRLGWR
jgi:hypothetical protein